MIRNAAVEGRFYPSGKKALLKGITEIEKEMRFAVPGDIPGRIIGAVLPHAGHIYSGHQTVPFFRYALNKGINPETIILLHPNHTGIGPNIALEENSIWRNSLGDVQIDSDLQDLLPYDKDSSSMTNEHSAEVIIPFIQHYFPKTKLLPVCIHQISSATAIELGIELVNAVEKSKKEVLVIASSDFSHFLSPEEGFAKDQKVLSMIDQRDIAGLEETVLRNHISVCGYAPIMALMAYCGNIARGYNTKILARGHSGEIQPAKEVVDYISILFQSKL